jgi:hypothetical protein
MDNVKRAVTVHVPANLNLEQAQRVLGSVLNKVGHPACYSGFNISFVNAVDPSPVILKVEAGSLKISEGG